MEKKEALTKGQADGAIIFSFDHGPYTEHQIVANISAAMVTGSLAVTAKGPGDSNYFAITGTIDLTSATTTVPVAKHIQDCPADAIKITPTGVPTGKTYTLRLMSWNEGLK